MKPPDPTVNDATEVGSYAWAALHLVTGGVPPEFSCYDAADIEEYEAQLADTPWPPPEPPAVIVNCPGQLDLFGGDAA